LDFCVVGSICSGGGVCVGRKVTLEEDWVVVVGLNVVPYFDVVFVVLLNGCSVEIVRLVVVLVFAVVANPKSAMPAEVYFVTEVVRLN
jgi:hypothetical protein